MKTTLIKIALMLCISTALFSFKPAPGGEGFELYLNSKLLVQKFGNNIGTAYTLDLNKASATDQLIVKYYHCGQAGKNRVITIKDENNKVLKQFRYADKTGPVSSISVPVKDIIDLKKGHAQITLYYSSSELPNARALASIGTHRQTS